MKTSPLTVDEKECIREVTIYDYRLFCFSVLFLLLTFSILLLMSGAEDVQKCLDISLEVCSAT
jgi:hypothetical protein